MRSRKRAVIRPDAHRDAALLAKFDQRRKPLANPRQLGCVLLIGVFADHELLRVGVIAGIDPHLVDPFGRFHRGLGFEMDIRDDRHIAAALAQTFDDVLQVARVFHRRRGDAHDLATTSASSIVCWIDASVSIVSHVIIDWTRIGLSPPMPTLPTITSRVARR